MRPFERWMVSFPIVLREALMVRSMMRNPSAKATRVPMLRVAARSAKVRSMGVMSRATTRMCGLAFTEVLFSFRDRLVEKVFVACAPCGLEGRVLFLPRVRIDDAAACSGEIPVHEVEASITAIEERAIVSTVEEGRESRFQIPAFRAVDDRLAGGGRRSRKRHLFQQFPRGRD